jgi:hypothetical protein
MLNLFTVMVLRLSCVSPDDSEAIMSDEAVECRMKSNEENEEKKKKWRKQYDENEEKRHLADVVTSMSSFCG